MPTSPITINISGDSLSLILDLLMVLITSVSAICAFVAYDHQKKRAKKEAACKLAARYADEILEKYSYIASVFIETKFEQRIQKTFPFEEIKDFDLDELRKILKKANISFDDFYSTFYELNPADILRCKINRTGSSLEREAMYNDFVKELETGKRELQNGEFLRNDFIHKVMELLNQFEWFSMNCRYGLADEGLLYQSLHQTFLSAIWQLYPYISLNNNKNEDKYFTNTIWLFWEWRKRLKQISNEANRKKVHYQKKADAVRPKIHVGSKLN